MCTWELEDGMCNSCGYTDGLDGYPSLGEDDDFNADAQSLSSLELEEILADHPDHLDYDSTGSENYRLHRRYMEHVRRRAGLPPGPLIRRTRPPPASASSIYGSSEDDYPSDESGSPSSSLRDFMVDDMADAGTHSDDSEDLSDYGSGPHGSGSERSHPTEEPSDLHSDGGSDTTLVTTARQRSRGRRIATSSPEMSDSESSVVTRASHQSNHHTGNSGFSPLQRDSDDGNPQTVPIQVDSDSDAPPIRRTRRRPRAVSVSSDEENNDTRGVRIQRLPSGMGSYNGAVNTGSQSPLPGIARQSGPQTSMVSNSAPSPILIGSSSAGTRSPRRDRSSNMLSPPVEPYRQRTPTGVPAHRSAHNDTSTTRRSGTRESFEQRRSKSPTGPSSASPRQTPEQRRQRKRAKRINRLRRLQERQSQSQPQQLAYIGV